MTYLNSANESDFSEITGRGPKNEINHIRSSVIGDRGSLNRDKFSPPEFSADPKKTDEFVQMYIDHYIPCLLICPEVKSDKILIFFHANAEDVSHAYIFCSHLRQKLNVFPLKTKKIIDVYSDCGVWGLRGLQGEPLGGGCVPGLASCLELPIVHSELQIEEYFRNGTVDWQWPGLLFDFHQKDRGSLSDFCVHQYKKYCQGRLWIHRVCPR